MRNWLVGLGLLGTVAFLAGCAGMSNTLAQDLAMERWEACRNPQVNLKEIRPDGQIWITYSPDNRKAFNDVSQCLRQASQEQAKRKGSVATTGSVVSTPISPSPPGGHPMPTWSRGDEWAYRWEDASSSGTFVWTVDRLEKIDGVEHWVVKGGTREIYYRLLDGAVVMEKLGGQISNRYVPEWTAISWPLTVGKSWDTRFTEHFLNERRTQDIARSCVAQAEESVTVPAGTFQAISILCSQARTTKLAYQQWYSPQVKHMVKEIGGTMVRELIAYKLRS